MKALIKASFVCALAVVLGMPVPDTAQAQGESAVPFLLIAPNSRAAGIGETGTGSVDDASAVFWNPGDADACPDVISSDQPNAALSVHQPGFVCEWDR